MKTSSITLFGLLTTLLASACIPATREVLVQPLMTMTVVDADKRPVPGASVLFVSASNPHHKLHHALRLTTDEQGRVHLDAKLESETFYPLMMHGVPFYYWGWCVEKAGYQPTVYQEHPPDESMEVTVELQPGVTAATCQNTGGHVFAKSAAMSDER